MVVVSGGGCDRGLLVMSLKRKAQAMEVLRANNKGREKLLDRVEKDEEIVGERNKGRLRNNKRWIKKNKKYLN